jgi:peptide deformylase
MKIITDLEFLRQKSRLTSIEECEKLGIFRQLDLMLRCSEGGYGLAAPQIGQLIQACIIRLPECCLNLVNPRIISAEDEILIKEGCLSFPGIIKTVKSYNSIHIVDDIKPEGGYLLEGLEAQCAIHELCHLSGQTIIDRAIDTTVRNIGPKFGPNDPCPKCGKKIKKCEHRKEFLR